MIRLRQVALVAADLEAVVDELCRTFDLTVCFHDPGVAEFGLHNALMVVGDQFIEVVAPTQPGTTAGRQGTENPCNSRAYELSKLNAAKAVMSMGNRKQPKVCAKMGSE